MPEYQIEKISETEVEVSVPSTETTRISLDQLNEQIRYHGQLLINELEEYNRKVAYHTAEIAKKEAQRDEMIALGVKTAEEVSAEVIVMNEEIPVPDIYPAPHPFARV